MDINPERRRCGDNQPVLADVIDTLSANAPTDLQPHLIRLADDLRYRTHFRPRAFNETAVGEAITTVRAGMIDAVPFYTRHQEAMQYFGVFG